MMVGLSRRNLLICLAFVLLVNIAFSQATQQYTVSGDFGSIDFQIPSHWEMLEDDYPNVYWQENDATFFMFMDTAAINNYEIPIEPQSATETFAGYSANIYPENGDGTYLIIIYAVGNEPAVAFYSSSPAELWSQYGPIFDRILSTMSINSGNSNPKANLRDKVKTASQTSAASTNNEVTWSAGKVMEMLSPKGGAVFNALLRQDDGKIIAAGTAKDADGFDVITVYRYNADGTRDTSFGTQGLVTVDHICQDSNTICGARFDKGAENVVGAGLQSDGKIVLAQTYWEGVNGYNLDPGFGLVRFTKEGVLDTSFGQHRGFAFGKVHRFASSMEIQSDNKILVVGQDKDHLLVSRFTSEGLPDLSFGNEGTFELPMHWRTGSSDITIQTDGKILAVTAAGAKICQSEPDNEIIVGRIIRVNENGTLDNSFGSNGVVVFNASEIFDVVPHGDVPHSTNPCQSNYLQSVQIQPDGKIVVLGNGTNSYISPFLVRFSTDGNVDRTFGYNGMIALFGEYEYQQFNWENTEFHYTADRYAAYDMKILANGEIAIVGYFKKGYADWDTRFLAIRFTKDGELIKNLGENGLATFDVSFAEPENDWLDGGAKAYDFISQPDGGLLLGGYAQGYYNPSHAVLVRIP